MKRPAEDEDPPTSHKRSKADEDETPQGITDDTVDDGYKLWHDLEVAEANYAKGSDSEDEPDEEAEGREAWDQLSAEEKATVSSAIKAWNTAKADEQTAEKLKRQHKGSYAGGPRDDDEYGDEDYGRPSFEQYRKSEENLHKARQKVWDLSEELLRLREGRKCKYVEQELERMDNFVITWEHIVLELPELEKAAKQKLEQRESRALSELGELGAGWVGSWDLGAGAFGIATLSVKQNHAGLIIDRVVIKDSYFPENDPDTDAIWRDRDTWTNGAPRSATNPSSVPVEVHALYSLRRCASSSILKIRNWRFGPGERSYRILTEFCPLGDLEDLFRDVGYSSLRRDNEPETDHSRSLKLLPEPFLWCLFHNLCTAGILMDRGELYRNPILPWEKIVHRDIKPNNVFLALPSSSSSVYKGYPVPKLGDWGLAYLCPGGPTSTCNPLAFAARGTEGYKAPEQNRMGTIRPLSSKTNVWAVGAVLYTMLAASAPKRSSNLSDTDGAFDVTAEKKYSQELRGLVLTCLRSEPDQRPSFDFLLKKIRRYTAPGSKDKAGDLRDASVNRGAFTGKFELDHGKNDMWALGSRLRDKELPENLDEFPSPPEMGEHSSEEEEEEDDLSGAPGSMIKDPRE